MTGNGLFDLFLLKCVHISTYLMKRRDPYKIFRPRMRFKTIQNGLNSQHNMAGNCLFDPFLLNYIHIYTYFVKKRDSYQIFRLSMKISWEPGSPSLSHPAVSKKADTLECP